MTLVLLLKKACDDDSDSEAIRLAIFSKDCEERHFKSTGNLMVHKIRLNIPGSYYTMAARKVQRAV